MSRDWIADESAEESTDASTDETAAEVGDESSPASRRRGGGGKTKLVLAAAVAAGLVLTLKGGKLYDRFWPGSPQRAAAVTPSAATSGVITITRVDKSAKATPTTAPSTPTAHAAPTASPTEHPAPHPIPAAAAPTAAAPSPLRPIPIPAPPAAPSAASAEAQRLAPALLALDTLRGHLQLYTLQHGGKAPEFARYPAWHQLTQHTRADGTVDPNGEFGPYLEAVPANPLNESVVIGLTRRTPEAGKALKTGGKLGWVYCVTTNTLYATDADGKTVLPEREATASAR
jgi:hypothetical protein